MLYKQVGNQKKEFDQNEVEGAAKKGQEVMLELKFLLNLNEIIKEIDDYRMLFWLDSRDWVHSQRNLVRQRSA